MFRIKVDINQEYLKTYFGFNDSSYLFSQEIKCMYVLKMTRKNTIYKLAPRILMQ